MSKIKSLTLILGVVIMSFLVGYLVLAQTWSEPSLAPPQGNIPAPINVGTLNQTKDAGLTFTTFWDRNNNIYFVDPNASVSAILAGNVGIGDTTPASLLTVGSGDLFQVNSSGNIVRINNVAYSWPSSQGAANTFLKNDSSGNLTWSTVPGGVANAFANIANNAGTVQFSASGADTLRMAAGSGLTVSFDSVNKMITYTPAGMASFDCGSGNAVQALTLANGVVTARTCAAAGTGTVTSISASGGVTASPNPITSAGSLSLTYPSKGCGGAYAIQSFDLNSSASPNCVGTAPLDASFVTINSEPVLSSERRLVAGTGITITDGGANTTVTIAATGGLPSGTSGQTLRHDGTSWVANSNLYNNGTSIGIGTTAPSYKLDLVGNSRFTGDVIVTAGLALGGVYNYKWPSLQCGRYGKSCTNTNICEVTCSEGGFTGRIITGCSGGSVTTVGSSEYVYQVNETTCRTQLLYPSSANLYVMVYCCTLQW